MALSRAAGRFMVAASAAATAATSRAVDALDRVALVAYARFGPPTGLELATIGGAAALSPHILRRGGTASSAENNSLAGLLSGIWFAVPKRKPSYGKKRDRQMNPLYQTNNLQNLYPCPKCERGLMKLRHHLCPCDQEALNCKAVVRVRMDGRRPTVADAAPGKQE